MAQAGLYKFLDAFLENMANQKDLQDLREEAYNVEPIVFVFEPTDLSKIMLKAAAGGNANDNWKPTGRDKKFIRESVVPWGEKLKAEIIALKGVPYGKGGVRLRFTSGNNGTDIKAFPIGSDWQKYGKNAILDMPNNSYQKIKTAYNATVSGYFKGCQDFFGTDAEGNDTTTGRTKKGQEGKGGLRTSTGKRLSGKDAGRFYHQGHKQDAGIAETNVQRVLQQTYDEHERAMKNLGIKDLAAMKKLIENSGAELSVIRADDNEGFETRLQFKGDNDEANKQTKKLKKAFLASCNSTVNLLGGALANIEGSDSILQRNRKLIIKEVVKGFKKQKGFLKVKTENTKLEKGTGKKASKTLGKRKATGGEVLTGGAMKIAVGKSRRTSKRRPAGPRMGIKNILGVLNARLPEQVADNMGFPRLENQTGRFAQSVRAVDVTETAQGFKSIGYTYSKSPYQVFESGSGTRFSSVARDPRSLIETSIREIVAQFGLGRLYTRRL